MATTGKDFQAAILEVFEEERNKRGISYRKLEERTGYNTGTLSKWLTGNTEMRVQVLYELCDGIGVDMLDVTRRAQDRLK